MNTLLRCVLPLLAVLSSTCATAASQQDSVHQNLINQIVALSEQGDPATLEKQQAGYFIDAIKGMNPTVPTDIWDAVRKEVNEAISNKTRSGYGEQGLLVQKFLNDENFSNDDLRHLILVLQDPILKKYADAMKNETQGEYMRNLSKATYNQVWFVVSVVARRHGLQTSNGTPANRQQTQAH